MIESIGVIGFGVVGSAVANGFNSHLPVYVYDKFKEGHDTLYDTVNKSDVLFVCVPTPTVNNEQDLSDIYSCIADIDGVAIDKKLIVIKSTIVPGTTRALSLKYPQHEFIFNPEFLTARTAMKDFLHQKQIIIGYNVFTENTENIFHFYSDRFIASPIKFASWETAELTKYMCNCMYALKVTAANQIYDAAKYLDVDYDDVKKLCLSNGWMSPMHLDVPGPDGNLGYSGVCFPKDMKAFVTWGKENGVDLSLFGKADSINNNIRDIEG